MLKKYLTLHLTLRFLIYYIFTASYMTQNILKQPNYVNWKISLLIFAFVFILYGNSIKNDYALDDNYVTVTTPEKPNNPRIEKGIKGIPKLFTSHYVETAAQSFEY